MDPMSRRVWGLLLSVLEMMGICGLFLVARRPELQARQDSELVDRESDEQEEPLTVGVKLGFGVWYKPDRWAPAELIVENQGEPLAGTISIETVPYGGGSRTKYSQKYSLFKGARKRFLFTSGAVISRHFSFR